MPPMPPPRWPPPAGSSFASRGVVAVAASALLDIVGSRKGWGSARLMWRNGILITADLDLYACGFALFRTRIRIEAPADLELFRADFKLGLHSQPGLALVGAEDA